MSQPETPEKENPNLIEMLEILNSLRDEIVLYESIKEAAKEFVIYHDEFFEINTTPLPFKPTFDILERKYNELKHLLELT